MLKSQRAAANAPEPLWHWSCFTSARAALTRYAGSLSGLGSAAPITGPVGSSTGRWPAIEPAALSSSVVYVLASNPSRYFAPLQVKRGNCFLLPPSPHSPPLLGWVLLPCLLHPLLANLPPNCCQTFRPTAGKPWARAQADASPNPGRLTRLAACPADPPSPRHPQNWASGRPADSLSDAAQRWQALTPPACFGACPGGQQAPSGSSRGGAGGPGPPGDKYRPPCHAPHFHPPTTYRSCVWVVAGVFRVTLLGWLGEIAPPLYLCTLQDAPCLVHVRHRTPFALQSCRERTGLNGCCLEGR